MTDFLVTMGTPTCWADTTDYNAAVSGIDRTHQIDLTSLADGDAWQGAKADLGQNRPPSYAVKVCLEFAVAPVAGEIVWIFWSSSYAAAAGTGNDGGVASEGVDGDWDPGGAAEADRLEYMRHLTRIGTFKAAADATTNLQVAMINEAFYPPTRYGFPIVFNQSGQALVADATEQYVALIPNTPMAND